MTSIDMKEDILAVNLEEEASVLETFKELTRRCPDEDNEVLRAWLKSRLADAATDRILGCHIIGPGAGDLIHEVCVAMEFGASAQDLALTNNTAAAVALTVGGGNASVSLVG